MIATLGSAIPDCYYSQHQPVDTDGKQALDRIQNKLTFQKGGYRFKHPQPMSSEDKKKRRFAIFIQSKRKGKNLPAQKIWQEYLKVCHIGY